MGGSTEAVAALADAAVAPVAWLTAVQTVVARAV